MPKSPNTLEPGAPATCLAGLLPGLRLPWEYAVLAAVLNPRDASQCHALVALRKERLEYAVYRVDVRDGSCHGGRYPGDDLPRAVEIYQEYVTRVLASLTNSTAVTGAGGAAMRRYGA